MQEAAYNVMRPQPPLCVPLTIPCGIRLNRPKEIHRKDIGEGKSLFLHFTQKTCARIYDDDNLQILGILKIIYV